MLKRIIKGLGLLLKAEAMLWMMFLLIAFAIKLASELL